MKQIKKPVQDIFLMLVSGIFGAIFYFGIYWTLEKLLEEGLPLADRFVFPLNLIRFFDSLTNSIILFFVIIFTIYMLKKEFTKY